MSNNSPSIIDGFSINYSSLFGHGAFSTCYRCSNPKYKIPLCVKIIQFTQRTSVTFDREIQIIQKLSQVESDNLVKILHLSQQNNFCYIFMEYCQQGDFQKLIENKKKIFTVEEILSILSQLISGYKHLYDFGIIHRDIKPANIFLGNNGCFQLGDYGMSKILENPSEEIEQSQAGTPYYAAPQVLFEGIYSNKCDIYSLGVIIYQLVYQKMPIPGCQIMQFIDELQKTKQNKILIRNIPKSLGGSQSEQQQLLNFLNSSLVFEESSRIGWVELFQQFLDPDISKDSVAESSHLNSSSLQQQSSQELSFQKYQNEQQSQQSTQLDNNNLSQPKETQFLRSNNKLMKANQTGEFKQSNQESQDNSKFQPFHSDQTLRINQDQQSQVRQFKLQKKPSICAINEFDDVLEKMLNFYQAKSTFVDKLINKIDDSFKYFGLDQIKMYQTSYTASLHLLQLYLYGYQYSSYLNINYFLFKRSANSDKLQIKKELSWVDNKSLEEQLRAYLKNQTNQNNYFQKQYQVFKQKFTEETNKCQEYQKYITDSQLLLEINNFNLKQSLCSPQLYYIQYKKMFKDINLNFDFEAEYSYLEDHTIAFLAFSIKFIQNEEKYLEKFQFLMADKQEIIELQENKRSLLKIIKQYFSG